MPRGEQQLRSKIFENRPFLAKYVENSEFSCFLSTRLGPLCIIYARQLFSCCFQSRLWGRFTGALYLLKIFEKFFVRPVW